MLALSSGLGFLMLFETLHSSKALIRSQIAVLSFGIFLAAALCVVRARQIIFQNWGGCVLPTRDSIAQDDQYDVFISYALEDQEWVRKELLTPLKNVRLPDGRALRILLDDHSFDFQAGRLNALLIREAIDNSKFIIPVYSEAYITKPYCMVELRLAHEKWIRERCVDAHRETHGLLPLMRGNPPIALQFSDVQFGSIDDPQLVAEIIARIVSTLSRKPQTSLPEDRGCHGLERTGLI